MIREKRARIIGEWFPPSQTVEDSALALSTLAIQDAAGNTPPSLVRSTPLTWL
jgi:hypothetical protein